MELSEFYKLQSFTIFSRGIWLWRLNANTLPDNLLAALHRALKSKESLGEYRQSCGYMNVIENCTQPNQRARCPNCGGRIAGSASSE
jgi:hypothetical protein